MILKTIEIVKETDTEICSKMRLNDRRMLFMVRAFDLNDAHLRVTLTEYR